MPSGGMPSYHGGMRKQDMQPYGTQHSAASLDMQSGPLPIHGEQSVVSYGGPPDESLSLSTHVWWGFASIEYADGQCGQCGEYIAMRDSDEYGCWKHCASGQH